MMMTLLLLSIMQADTLYLALDQAIDYALRNNPEIEQLSFTYEKSETQVGQARAAFYPSITASGGYAYITNIPVIELDSIPISFGQSENYNLSVSAQQVLFAWGTIYNAYKITDLNSDIAELNLLRKQQELRYEVADAFYGLLVLEEMVDLSRESLDQLRRHAAAVETRYRAGLVPQFDLLRAQVQVANLKPQVINAENGLKLAREGFKMLLGLDLDTEYVVDGDLEIIQEDFVLDTLTDIALRERIELKNLKKYRQIAQLGKQIAARANLPTVVAGATYERVKPFGFMGDEWGSNVVFNIGFQMTLFSGFKNQYAYREAALQKQEAQLAYENLQKAVTFEVKQAYLNLQAAGEALETAQENVAQAEMAFNIIDKRYRSGLATNLEYMDAQLAAQQARTNYLSALKDYYTSRAGVYKAIGKEE
jgi:outer membrane protein TolC